MDKDLIFVLVNPEFEAGALVAAVLQGDSMGLENVQAERSLKKSHV